MQYALIQNNTVENVIVADAAFIAAIAADWQHIEPLDTLLEQGQGVGIGWTYDGAFHAPAQPEQPPEPPAPRHITVGSFFDRFGANKWPILADTNPLVQALIKDCSVRAWINLDDPQLPFGLELLVEAGHAVDVHAVLTAPIQPSEKP